ncbi:hypothetical protein [Bradyrhizobium sp. CCBAU 53415]|uniref:hypothetical protein n=1 Tax=Bradyrhizobium sp. CCBAU 53415 TaxID=1325119 RepID=UPI002306D950|nr:hypothetical protein [Bradyrhizobium sp. CCBAU 53415]MDA9466559.1 hypothetical protein [Bradyrhizobium sp. CCBAU 53415]
MALSLPLRKEPAARLRADRDKLTTRRPDLVSQLDAEKATASSLTDDLHTALISGNVSRSEIAAKEARLADAERRVSGLTSALAALDIKIVEAQSALDELLASEAAEQAVADLSRGRQEYAAKLNAFLDAAAEFLPAVAKLGEHAFVARELAGLARSIGVEVPIAARRLEGELDYIADMIKRERPAQFVKVDRAA